MSPRSQSDNSQQRIKKVELEPRGCEKSIDDVKSSYFSKTEVYFIYYIFYVLNQKFFNSICLRNGGVSSKAMGIVCLYSCELCYINYDIFAQDRGQ